MVAIGATQAILSKLMMLFLAVLAMPMDTGETIRVDRVGSAGIYDTFEVTKTEKEFQVFQITGDKKVEKAIFRPTDKDGHYQFIEDGKVTKTVDVGAIIQGVDVDKLGEVGDAVLSVKDSAPVRMQRSESLLYLIAAQSSQVYVVRKK